MDQHTNATGTRIRSLRENKDLQQPDLAKLAKIEQSYVSKLERGLAPNVSGIILGRLALVLETTVDYLLGLTSDPTPRPVNQNHPALQDPDFREIMDLWPEFSVAIKQATKNLLVHVASHKNAS
jgi:transcriptional regulator with XRE-family HTH domain